MLIRSNRRKSLSGNKESLFAPGGGRRPGAAGGLSRASLGRVNPLFNQLGFPTFPPALAYWGWGLIWLPKKTPGVSRNLSEIPRKNGTLYSITSVFLAPWYEFQKRSHYHDHATTGLGGLLRGYFSKLVELFLQFPFFKAFPMPPSLPVN